MSGTRSMVSLLDSIREHLAAFDLPEPIRMDLDPEPLPDREYLGAHLRALSLGMLASDLLAWAETLTEVSVTAWRPPEGNSVHLSVLGGLADGTTLRAWGGVYDSRDRIGLDLDPRQTRTITLGALRAWATVDSAGAVV